MPPRWVRVNWVRSLRPRSDARATCTLEGFAQSVLRAVHSLRVAVFEVGARETGAVVAAQVPMRVPPALSERNRRAQMWFDRGLSGCMLPSRWSFYCHLISIYLFTYLLGAGELGAVVAAQVPTCAPPAHWRV